MSRCKALSEIIPQCADCALIENAVSRRYFTDFPSSDGMLVVTREYAVFGVDGRYIEAAKQKISGINVIQVSNYGDFLKELLQKLSVKKVVVEGSTSLARLKSLKGLCGSAEFFSDGGFDEGIKKLRMIKNRDEIRRIIEAQRLTDLAFTHICNFLRPGVTERDAALELEFFMKRQGAEKESFDTIVVSGKRTSMPHGVPTEREIEKGDFVTMDFGAIVDGYHSDMTRTVAIGSVTDEMKEVYNTVLKSQKAGIAALAPGLKCRDADKICRDIISEAGFGEYFTHSTGHGVGLDIHEFPNLSPLSPDTLEKGNVVTVEPGIYVPGKFGVRIEDFGCVTSNDFEDFTESEKELTVI